MQSSSKMMPSDSFSKNQVIALLTPYLHPRFMSLYKVLIFLVQLISSLL